MAIHRALLEQQADRIDAVLASHRIQARVVGGSVMPRVIRFELLTSVGTKVRKVSNLAEEFALALNCRHVRVARNQGRITLDVPRLRSSTVQFSTLNRQLEQVPPVTAILGADEEGVPLLLRLPAPDVAHVLIAGTTGSGKTALTRTLISSLAIRNSSATLRLVLIDPKRRGFAPLANFPHVDGGGVIDSPEIAAQRLRLAVSEMERRDMENIRQPALIIAVDELADIIQTGGKSVQSLLTRLSQRGREAGIHLVCCTQKPTSQMIGSAIKANFPVRLVGAVASRDEARYATGISDSGAERLNGRGDFLLIAKGEAIRFQAAWLGANDLSSFAAAM